MNSMVYQVSLYLIIGLSFYMAYCDIKTMTIKLYLQGLFFVLVTYYQVTYFEEYKLSFLIALLSFLLFLKGNLGGADKKLIPLQGLALSLKDLVFYYFFLSFFYLLQIYIKRKNGIKRPLPFYPIILLAYLLALVLSYLSWEIPMTLDYEGYLKLIEESNENKDESNEFLFNQDTNLNYETKETEKEELKFLIEKYFTNTENSTVQTRTKLSLKELNRKNAYFKAKALRLSKDRDLSYLKDLEKEALLEHILILEYAFDFAMNALEEKNKGNYYEF